MRRAGPDCKDTRRVTIFAKTYVDGNVLYYSDVTASPQSIQVLSFSNDSMGPGGCESNVTLVDVVPVLSVTLPPFTPPLHVEVEDCIRAPAVASLGPRALLAMCVLLAFGAVVWMRRPRSA